MKDPPPTVRRADLGRSELETLLTNRLYPGLTWLSGEDLSSQYERLLFIICVCCLSQITHSHQHTKRSRDWDWGVSPIFTKRK